MAKTATTYYDTYNRAYATKYPDGEIVKVNFNSLGLPKLMCSSYLHSSGSYWCTSDPWYVSNASYDEAGRLTAMQYPAGGNLWRTQSYYPWTTARSGGLLNEIKVGTSNGASNRFYRQYSYNSYGDVNSMKETSGGTPNTFTYDSLDRLTSAYGQSFSYDQAGRRTDGGRGYDTAQPYHGLKSMLTGPNGYIYQYDANGNMAQIRDTGNNLLASYTWNAENRLSSATKNGVTENYAYDADGSRINTTSSGVTTRTFFPFYEEENGVAVKYYTFNGQRIAVRRGGTLSYLHTDHLGSSSLATDASGNAIPVNSQGVRYYAYGAVRSGDPATLQTDRTFTGQKVDETGLMFFEARYYDNALGTFVSPDTIVPEPGRAVDYNRFAYTRNNPLRYSDPTGHFSQEEIDAYLQSMYGDDWQRMRSLWQMDKVWWYILETAELGWDIWASELSSVSGGFRGQFAKDGNGKLVIVESGTTNSHDLWQVQGHGAYDLRGPNNEHPGELYAMQNGYHQLIFNYDNQGKIQDNYLGGYRAVYVDATFFGLGRGKQFSYHETQSPWGRPTPDGFLWDAMTQTPVVGETLGTAMELTVSLVEYVLQPKFYVTRDSDIYTGSNLICPAPW